MTDALSSATWRKASRSSGGANNCVEVALAASQAGIRDTKDRANGHLAISPSAFDAFRTEITAKH